jgi:hypothetical protein
MKKLNTEIIQISKAPHSSSETIVHSMIEKIISLAISDFFTRNVEKQIPEKCWSYMRGMFDKYIQLEFFAIDRDDLYIDPLLDEKDLFNNKTIGKKLSLIKKIDVADNIRSSELNFLKNDINFQNLPNFPNPIPTGNSAGVNSIDSIERSDSNNFNTENLMVDNNIIVNQINYDSGNNKNLLEKKRSEIGNRNIFYDNKYSSQNNWSLVEQPVSSNLLAIRLLDIYIFRYIFLFIYIKGNN